MSRRPKSVIPSATPPLGAACPPPRHANAPDAQGRPSAEKQARAQASAAGRLGRLAERLGRGERARWIGLAAAAALAALTLVGLVGLGVLLHPGRSVIGRNPAADFQIMTWSLAWWPWAIRHGVNPLHTTLLWSPTGFSTLWMTTIPVPALLALPLTLTAGPLVAYNALMAAAVVLATGAAYLLCHELTGRAVPSLLGAVVFGLSPYMLGHTLSEHLDLVFVFPLPLLTLLGIRYARHKTSSRRFVLGSALLLLILMGSSLELFVDLTLIIVVVGAVGVAFAPQWRPLLTRIGAGVTLAYAACLPVLGPVAILGLSSAHGPVRNAPSGYAVDLLNVVVPTPTTLVGVWNWLHVISGHFVGNIGERDGYVGLPLLAVAVLTLRSEWRRGAWLAGTLVATAFLLSLGPTLTVDGRPLVDLPFAVARLPVLGDALPARMSLFATLGLACLCALWFAQRRSRLVSLAVGALVVVSLLPNFWPPRALHAAWAVPATFTWSTPQAPVGFSDDPRWPTLVEPGSNVLVIPTADRTAASYWQVRAGMGFTLAIPETPFSPTQLAASPIVARLVDNNLPQLDGVPLGAARLRAFLRADRVGAVVVTRSAGPGWRQLVRRATGTLAVDVKRSFVYRVRAGLKPLALNGERTRSRASPGSQRPGAPQPSIRAWLHFAGARAILRVRLDTPTGRVGPVTLSSAAGDAEAPSVAVDGRGRAAVVFTEWRSHRLLLRVATHQGSGWRLATLDSSTLPIWSPKVAVTDGGTVVAAWIDDTGADRSLRADVLRAGGRWHAQSLDNGQGLDTVSLGAGHDNAVVVAWRDLVSREARIRAATYTDASWHPTVTLTHGLGWLGAAHVASSGAAVRWQASIDGLAYIVQARRREITWGKVKIFGPPPLPYQDIRSTHDSHWDRRAGRRRSRTDPNRPRDGAGAVALHLQPAPRSSTRPRPGHRPPPAAAPQRRPATGLADSTNSVVRSGEAGRTAPAAPSA